MSDYGSIEDIKKIRENLLKTELGLNSRLTSCNLDCISCHNKYIFSYLKCLYISYFVAKTKTTLLHYWKSLRPTNLRQTKFRTS